MWLCHFWSLCLVTSLSFEAEDKVGTWLVIKLDKLKKVQFRNQVHGFVLQATEVQRGRSGASTRSVVVVDIVDVNDNAPTFRRNSYSYSVKEGQTGSFFIRDLVVSDPDEVNRL